MSRYFYLALTCTGFWLRTGTTVGIWMASGGGTLDAVSISILDKVKLDLLIHSFQLLSGRSQGVISTVYDDSFYRAMVRSTYTLVDTALEYRLSLSGRVWMRTVSVEGLSVSFSISGGLWWMGGVNSIKVIIALDDIWALRRRFAAHKQKRFPVQ